MSVAFWQVGNLLFGWLLQSGLRDLDREARRQSVTLPADLPSPSARIVRAGFSIASYSLGFASCALFAVSAVSGGLFEETVHEIDLIHLLGTWLVLIASIVYVAAHLRSGSRARRPSRRQVPKTFLDGARTVLTSLIASIVLGAVTHGILLL